MTNPIVIIPQKTVLLPRLRLFCLPYAGGGASIYQQWYKFLPDDVEVQAIQLPGRENRFLEPPYTQLSLLLEDLTEALSGRLDRPYAFFGYSLGALISFEMTRRLRSLHLPLPQRLLLAAHRAPQLPRRSDTLHLMEDAEFMASLKKLGGTPEAILQHEELMQLLLPMLRADFTLYETYQYLPQEPFSFPITVFGGSFDADINEADLVPWREQTTDSFQLIMFPGAHFFINSHRDQLLQCVRQVLEV